jgi:hypothetical protein
MERRRAIFAAVRRWGITAVGTAVLCFVRCHERDVAGSVEAAPRKDRVQTMRPIVVYGDPDASVSDDKDLD